MFYEIENSIISCSSKLVSLKNLLKEKFDSNTNNTYSVIKDSFNSYKEKLNTIKKSIYEKSTNLEIYNNIEKSLRECSFNLHSIKNTIQKNGLNLDFCFSIKNSIEICNKKFESLKKQLENSAQQHISDKIIDKEVFKEGDLKMICYYKMNQFLEMFNKKIEYNKNYFSQKIKETEMYTTLKNSVEEYTNKYYASNNFVSKIRDKFKNSTNYTDETLSNEEYFICNDINFIGLNNEEAAGLDKSLKKCLLTRKNKICHKRFLFNDILFLKKTKLFKNIKIYICKNNNQDGYNVFIRLQKFHNDRIRKISFSYANLLPNYVKNLIISEFTGKKASLTNLSVIKHTLDSWYSKWDYLGSHVDSVKKINNGYYQIYVKEIFISSINFILFNYEEFFFSSFYDADNTITGNIRARNIFLEEEQNDFDSLDDPVTTIFLKLCSSKVGQPYDSNMDEVCFEFEDEVAFSMLCIPVLDSFESTEEYDLDEIIDEAYVYYRQEMDEEEKEKEKNINKNKINVWKAIDSSIYSENVEYNLNSIQDMYDKDRSYNYELEINPVFLDVLVFSEICSQSSFDCQIELLAPRNEQIYTNFLDMWYHYDPDDYVMACYDAVWNITKISERIEMITLSCEKDFWMFHFFPWTFEEGDFEVEYYLPFFNLNADSVLSSMIFLLFNETGCIVLQDIDEGYDPYVILNEELYMKQQYSYSTFGTEFLNLKKGLKKDYFLYNKTRTFNDRKIEHVFDYLDYDNLDSFFYGNTELLKSKNYDNLNQSLMKEKNYLQKNLNLLAFSNNLILSNEYFKKKIENNNLLNDLYQTKIKFYINSKSEDTQNANPEYYDLYEEFVKTRLRRGRIWELDEYPEKISSSSEKIGDIYYPEIKYAQNITPNEAYFNHKKIYKEDDKDLYYFKKYYKYSTRISYYTFLLEPETKMIDGIILNNVSKKNKEYVNHKAPSNPTTAYNKDIFKTNKSNDSQIYNFFSRKYEIGDKIESYLNNTTTRKKRLSKNLFYNKEYFIEDDLITYKSGIKLIIDEKINLRSKYITTYTLNYVIFTDEYPDDDEIEAFPTATERNSTKFGNTNRDGYMYTTSLQNLDVKVSTQGLYIRNSLKFLSGTISGSKLLLFMELGFGINGVYGKTVLDLTNYSLIGKNSSIRKLYNYVYQNIKNYDLICQNFKLNNKLETLSKYFIQHYMKIMCKSKSLINKFPMFAIDIVKKIENHTFRIKNFCNSINYKLENINEIFVKRFFMNVLNLFNGIYIFQKNKIKNVTEILYYNTINIWFNKIHDVIFKKCKLYICTVCKNLHTNKKIPNNDFLIELITYKIPCYKNIGFIEKNIQSLKFCNIGIINYFFCIKNIGYRTKNFVKNFNNIMFPVQNKYKNYKNKYIYNMHLKSNLAYFIKNILKNSYNSQPKVLNSYFVTDFYRKIINLLVSPFPLTLVNHIKLGYSFGHIPFYEGFLMGGPFSARGYKSGEIGLSKHILQSSFELRYLKSTFLDCVFVFLDHCSDLSSSEQLIYNPSDYKLCCGQGSSLGVGVFLGNARIEYGFNTTTLKNFMNFEYGERY
ncbi:outer plastid envelop protein 75 (nucleomorph) [Lotharella oceanica]|uniref:Outer plastid envelop protein 75 n=2 Tax=Lotharella oceanica TaxID=641309 RepID=A0A060DBC3_9EUKA|nr:outer plastid envelop protein 75 [Lotharella oceanica]